MYVCMYVCITLGRIGQISQACLLVCKELYECMYVCMYVCMRLGVGKCLAYCCQSTASSLVVASAVSEMKAEIIN